MEEINSIEKFVSVKPIDMEGKKLEIPLDGISLKGNTKDKIMDRLKKITLFKPANFYSFDKAFVDKEVLYLQFKSNSYNGSFLDVEPNEVLPS